MKVQDLRRRIVEKAKAKVTSNGDVIDEWCGARAEWAGQYLQR
ncbi:hypothetical protein ACFL6C_11200 [Myxococcota bacterium]